jgi:HD-like signal output (HDOD) protein
MMAVTGQTEYSIYRRVVSQLMNGEEQLPSLPAITLEIRRALTCPETSLHQLTHLIAKDPALSALLMKHASSALLRTRHAPKTLHDVVRLLGVTQVDQITMIHSIKSLFTLHSSGHKQLFMEIWERLILKASISAFLARILGHTEPEHALLACLLSEVGTLAVLSAFKDENVIPSRGLYYNLCREYSKSLGVIVLKKWAVDDSYITVIRNIGDWQFSPGDDIELIDLVNLSLYHAIKEMGIPAELPDLGVLPAFRKLYAPMNFISASGELTLVTSHRAEIHAIADQLRH